MRIECSKDDLITIEIGEEEASRLLFFLIHAKFSESPKAEIFLNSEINEIIRKIIQCGRNLGYKDERFDLIPYDIDSSGFQPPEIFEEIKKRIQLEFPESEWKRLIAEAVYPFKWSRLK